MLESLRRAIAVPQVPVHWLLSVATIASFGWLLTQDRIHPLVVYCLQLYLSF